MPKLYLWRRPTFVVVFDPDPRVPGQSDPERFGRRGVIGQVVDERRGGVGVGQSGTQRR